MATSTIRYRNLARLSRMGFRVASWLPTQRSETSPALRPTQEIASRLLSLTVLFLWTAESGELIPSETVGDYLKQQELSSFLTESERKIVCLDRPLAWEQHRETIGWRLENMWSLAWLVGFDPTPDLSGMMSPETIESILTFVPVPETPPAAFIESARIRSVEEADELEDFFYCAHNAVRSAQLGNPTVPANFHPLLDGGCVHERRHSLTWALSPGIDWNDTDLST